MQKKVSLTMMTRAQPLTRKTSRVTSLKTMMKKQKVISRLKKRMMPLLLLMRSPSLSMVQLSQQRRTRRVLYQKKMI